MIRPFIFISINFCRVSNDNYNENSNLYKELKHNGVELITKMVRDELSVEFIFMFLDVKVQQLKVWNEHFYIFMDIVVGVGIDNVVWLGTMCNEVHDLNFVAWFN